MSYTLKPGERQELLEMANHVARNAHAVYSGFRVGAAVLGESGTYLGTNIENASYPVGLCAERAALAAAVAANEKHIRAIAVACIDAPLDGPRETLFPCGACRQWFAELAPDAVIVVGGVDDREFTVGELLPHAFLLARS